MLSLYNTLTRQLEPFTPEREGEARVYGCGPTIYDYAHIGNFRSFLVYDLVHRYLEWSGYRVQFVTNLTDVDDKTIHGAAERGVSLQDFTAPFGEAFLADADRLGIRRADHYPRATEYVPQMIRFVERLLERGVAYVAEDGSVYFSIERFPGYGRLSRKDLSAMRPGARVAVDEYKDDARDFVLWKRAKEEDRAVGASWDSPWGPGRPGWHLECSVMSTELLGDTLDLHLGGEDLIFPHHEDEIAQSEACTGHTFSHRWLHIKHLLVEGEKMSKSRGNFFTLRGLVEKGYAPSAIRHLLLSAHYRSELNFTFEALEGSRRAVRRLLDFQDRLLALPLVEGAPGWPELEARAVIALQDFQRAMDDDLNTSGALAALFGWVSDTHAALDREGERLAEADRDVLLGALVRMDEVLGLLELARGEVAEARERDKAWVEEKIEQRVRARAERDFARADAIRAEVLERGYVLEDFPGGTRWKPRE